MRIATFNLENLDDEAGQEPSLATRMAIMRPQLQRIAADVLCLQEVHSQDSPQGRTLAALDSLLAGTRYEDYQRLTTTTTRGDLYQERNLVTLSRFPLVQHPRTVIRDSSGPRPAYQVATADPPDQTADPLEWERPILYAQVDLGGGRLLPVLNLHLKSKIATDIQGQKLDNFTWKTPAAWAEGSFISSMKRVGQALQVRLEIDRLFDQAELAGDPAPLIAICGDFNAESDEVPCKRSAGRWRTPATPPTARGCWWPARTRWPSRPGTRCSTSAEAR
jgi:endonuclease/exonuclease/phosphatase family metal-dependent hydrolase